MILTFIFVTTSGPNHVFQKKPDEIEPTYFKRKKWGGKRDYK